ncbi:MAG: hypothetical protein OXF20_14835 [Gammaproteobacteria bacterium]|nr:hypothetical protein [Gammaproteobacteria bacterium]
MHETPEALIERLVARDQSLWPGEHSPPLGWLDSVDFIEQHGSDLMQWASLLVMDRQVKQILLMGMGGSSLSVEVLYSVFGRKRNFPELVVVDTTSPETLNQLEINDKTLFVVSSKSGTTIETLALYSWLHERAKTLDGPPNKRFLAITDPGTQLAKTALSEEFLHLSVNPRDIVGRYSALSYFALLPAALLGIDLVRLGSRLRKKWLDYLSGQSPDLVNLIEIMSACSTSGYGLLGLDLPSPLGSLFAWIEQLVAESTGKQGKGILPVEPDRINERMVSSGNYRSVKIGMQGCLNSSDEGHQAPGHATITMQDEYDLGGIFMLWMAATSVVSSLLNVNAFDQPDVEASKKQSRHIVEGNQSRSVMVENHDFSHSTIRFDTQTPDVIRNRVGNFCKQAGQDSYLAILAYLPREVRVEESLEKLADAFKSRFGAVTIGFGPRYLHSTGQLHKGGPQIGCFLEIVEEGGIEIDIPGRKYGFSRLHRAQSDGDFLVLEKSRRPILRLLIRGDRFQELDRLTQLLLNRKTTGSDAKT